MDEQEFRDRARLLFRRSPLVPVVFVIRCGSRVIVDMPEQLEMMSGAVLVRRRTEPTPYRIDYEQIERLLPLDELPGDGGPSYAEFYATVRPLLWAEPYQPFALELKDGTRLLIDRPGRLSLAGRFGTFAPLGPTPLVHFTYDQVAKASTSDLARAG